MLRGVTLMPGTAGNDASARFSVRGGREDEVMVLLDGFEVYEAYHLKDYSSALSVVAPETVAGVELLSGGFSAEYGDRMSGVLNVVTLDPSARRTRLGLSALNVRGQGSGTFWGHYYRSQRLYELQVEDGETSFSTSERAEHTSVGFEHTFGAPGGEDRRPLALRAELYQRRIRDPRPRWENLFEPISKVPELEPDRVRIAPESSLARGLEIFLSGSAGRRVDWFLSYTLSSVEDRLGGRDVPRSIDQPHALQLDFDVRAPWKVDLNLAVRYHTGRPTTAIGEPELVLGPLYGERVPDYFRVDLRASRTFRLSRGELVFFLDVQNLTSRGNVRGFEVDLEGADGVEVSPNSWGRILPTFGVSWTF